MLNSSLNFCKMKPILLFLFVFFSFSSFAQMEFSPQGAEWYHGQSYSDFAGLLGFSYSHSSYVGDVVLGGMNAKVIETITYHDDISSATYDTIAQVGDSILVRHEGAFDLLYDFGVGVNDTVRISNWALGGMVDMVVQQIDTVEINGTTLLDFTYYLDALGASFRVNNKFGIIDNDFLHYPESLVIDYTTGFTFRCYGDDGFDFYHATEDPCDTLLRVGILEPKLLDVEIFPNPTGKTLNIDFDQSVVGLLAYRIYDLPGSVRATGVLTDGRVDVSHLPQGMYFVEMTSKDGFVVRRTFQKF